MIYISIVLSAYNHEKSILQCLDSIIAQENADMQIECIVVDDCSTDDTLGIIRRRVGGYKGNIVFRIYRHQTHHGSLYLFFRQENSFISSIFKNPVFRNYRRVVDDITEMLEVIVGR